MAYITLLSDFGLQDPTAAIARGILLQHNPHTPIIDISHEVSPYKSYEAAYLLAATYTDFPEGSFHLILFDLFSEVRPRMALVTYNGHYFISADNGLLSQVLTTDLKGYLCFELQSHHSFKDWLHTAAALISRLQQQPPEELHLPALMLRNAKTSLTTPGNDDILNCEVIHIDHYENVILNITRRLFDATGKGRPFTLEFMLSEEITELSTHYNDVRPGNKLCRFNSDGYLEICINRGKAASLFGLKLGSKHNNIKLTFQ